MGRWVAFLDRYEVEKKERGTGADVLAKTAVKDTGCTQPMRSLTVNNPAEREMMDLGVVYKDM